MAEDKANRPAHQEKPAGLARIQHIIAIASGKGGVGKSTVSTNFAIALSKSGARVGLMDADVYGPSQPAMLGAMGKQPETQGDYLIPLKKHGLTFMSIGLLLAEGQPVIWRGPMASKLIQQFLGNVLWGDLDYLIVDLPPGSGDVQITLAQQAHLSGAIIVTTPQQVALGVAQKGLRMFEHVNVPIVGIIENMSGFTCPNCGTHTAIFKTGGGAKMAEKSGVNFLGSIPIDPELMASSDEGTPLMDQKIDSPSVKAFLEIAERFKSTIKEGVLSTDEPKDINLSEEGNLAIEWPDGAVEEFTPYDLRINAPDPGADTANVPLDIKIKAFERVGRYAIVISFSDGHDTGIYDFSKLRELNRKKSDSSRQSFSV
jgi:ATP-binding protein involved in chromosome partitioning